MAELTAAQTRGIVVSRIAYQLLNWNQDRPDQMAEAILKSLENEFSYRRLPQGDHLLPDKDREQISTDLLYSMPGNWKRSDVIEICVRSMSQICLKYLRGEK